MRNFQLMAAGVQTIHVMHELQRNAYLWDQHTLRTKHPGTAHSEVSDIWVFFNQFNVADEDINNPEAWKVIDDRDVVPYEAWHKLPSLRRLIFALMNQVEAIRIGRVIITRLPPGKQITPHKDMGAPATYFERYQIALQSKPGAMFHIGNEAVNFNTGEIWHIDNTEEHSVVNNSDDDRIVVIVDLRCE